MVTGSWNYSQVTVHVHGQEVLSEETVHLGAEPESPSELQDPVQSLTPRQSPEETTQSPDRGAPAEQRPHQEEELQSLQESGGKPQQKGGIVAEGRQGGGCSPVPRELGRLHGKKSQNPGCQEETEPPARVP